MYQFAGDGGGILIDFTPDTAPAFMKAADRAGHRRQGEVGLVDPDREHVHGSAVLPQFDGHLWINQEFSNVDPKVGPDSALMFPILKKYAPKIAPQAFAQMGFMDGKFADERAAEHQGRDHRGVVQRGGQGAEEPEDRHALQAVLRRQPRYHIPNNWDITVDYKGGNVVVKEGCFAIQAGRQVDRPDARLGEEVQAAGLERSERMRIRVPRGSDD